MDVKGAVKFLRNHFKIGIYEKISLDIISLLKRLEKYEKCEVISELLVDENKKYRQILIKIREIADDVHYHNDAEYNCEKISELIKEANPNEANNR